VEGLPFFGFPLVLIVLKKLGLGVLKLLDVIFYFQVLCVLALIGYAFFSKNWAFFVLAAVFTMLTGAMIMSGESIEYATGTFTIVQSFGGDGNVTRVVPDFNAFSASTSEPIFMWGNVMTYGGFVLLIIAFVLAGSAVMSRRDGSVEGIV